MVCLDRSFVCYVVYLMFLGAVLGSAWPRGLAHAQGAMVVQCNGGVQVAALVVGGRGAGDPIAPNTLPDGRDNPAGRQQNRRVEVLLRP